MGANAIKGIQRFQKNLKPREDYKQLINENGYFYDGDIFNLQDKYEWYDTEGYKYLSKLASMKNGQFPLKFSTTNPFTMDNIKNYLKLNCKNMTLIEGQEFTHSKNHLYFKCGIHGEFKSTLSNITKESSSKMCAKCYADTKKISLEQTILEFKNIHSDKYDYSLVHEDFDGVMKDVKIICKEHGVFKQMPSHHKVGNGCQICARKNTNPSGWTHDTWKISGGKSKGFVGFQTYIIRVWNEDEQFWKCGITFTEIKKRFHKKAIPYKWEVVEIKNFGEDAESSYKLEKQIHKENKHNKYIPKIKFGGSTECYLTPISFNKII